MNARTTTLAALVLLATACDADGAVTQPEGDASSTDAAADTGIGDTHVTSSEVSVDPFAPPFDGADVQSVLAQVVAALGDLAEVPAALAALEARVVALEEASAPPPPSAAEVPFDDSITALVGPTVQDFGEALDDAVNGLFATVAEIAEWRADVDEGLTSNAAATVAVSESLAGMKQTVAIQAWSGGITVEDEPVVVDPIFAIEDFGYDLSVHDGLQIVWSYVRAIEQWHADQMTGPKCPSDMTNLYQGSRHCVDMARSAKTAFVYASETCRDEGKRLCTVGEFMTYCRFAALLDSVGDGVNKGIPAPEWVEGVLGTTEPSAAALHGADCNQMVTHPLSLDWGQTEYFRCCKDPHSDLPPLPEPSPIPKGVELP